MQCLPLLQLSLFIWQFRLQRRFTQWCRVSEVYETNICFRSFYHVVGVATFFRDYSSPLCVGVWHVYTCSVLSFINVHAIWKSSVQCLLKIFFEQYIMPICVQSVTEISSDLIQCTYVAFMSVLAFHLKRKKLRLFRRQLKVLRMRKLPIPQ